MIESSLLVRLRASVLAVKILIYFNFSKVKQMTSLRLNCVDRLCPEV
jgi:hypothetical protein